MMTYRLNLCSLQFYFWKSKQLHYDTIWLSALHIQQGTAGVALAGLLGTVRAQGLPLKDFVKQKIVVVGAGRYFNI